MAFHEISDRWHGAQWRSVSVKTRKFSAASVRTGGPVLHESTDNKKQAQYSELLDAAL